MGESAGPAFQLVEVDRGDIEISVVETGTVESANNATLRCKVEALLGTVGGQGSATGKAGAGAGAGGQGGSAGAGGAAGGSGASGASGQDAAAATEDDQKGWRLHIGHDRRGRDDRKLGN